MHKSFTDFLQIVELLVNSLGLSHLRMSTIPMSQFTSATAFLQTPGRVISQALKGLFLHLHDHIVPHARNHYQPHLLHHRTIGLFSLLLLSLKVSTIVVTTFGAIDPAFSSAITIDNVLRLTNESRVSYDAPVLTYNKVLEKAAQAKAEDMLAKGYFAHNTPDGKTPWDFIKAAGYSYITAGENLALGYTQAETVGEAWMNSPGHKANIINKYFEEIGIGISQGEFEGHNAIFVVQMFGTSVNQPVALKNEPTIVAKPAPVASAVPVVQKTTPQTQATQEPIQTSSPIVVTTPVVPSPVPGPGELKLIHSTATLKTGFLEVAVETTAAANKVLATFGSKAVLLLPGEGNTWSAVIPLAYVQGRAVSVAAFDIAGSRVSEQIANFTNDLQTTYNPFGAVRGEAVEIFGAKFNPKVFESKFYLLFVAAILGCLVIAIAVHRHIQHPQLVANSAFVVVLAMLLWLG